LFESCKGVANPFLQGEQRAYGREPPTLVVWGKNNAIFPAEGATPYARDLKTIETQLLDTGHSALETHVDEVARRIEDFFRHHQLIG
jgi:pimeloyl-ACP methyl ester carboxylesterase